MLVPTNDSCEYAAAKSTPSSCVAPLIPPCCAPARCAVASAGTVTRLTATSVLPIRFRIASLHSVFLRGLAHGQQLRANPNSVKRFPPEGLGKATKRPRQAACRLACRGSGHLPDRYFVPKRTPPPSP